MRRWFEVPKKARYVEYSSRARADLQCRTMSDCLDIKDDCNGCIFQSSDWTSERKTAFLEWEKEQREKK